MPETLRTATQHAAALRQRLQRHRGREPRLATARPQTAWFAGSSRSRAPCSPTVTPRAQPGRHDHDRPPGRAGTVPAPDLLVGGTPCQSFSVAGARRGLADPRGALTLAYVELANAIDQTRRQDRRPPAASSGENVPGVLSDCSNAFGHFLGALAGESRALEPPGQNGRTQVVCLGPGAASPGACSMLNISASPNGAVACFLWQVVEVASIPPRYF